MTKQRRSYVAEPDDEHSFLDIPCAWRPSCAAWLRNPNAPEPDHLCYDIMRATVEHFAGQRFIVCDIPFFWGHYYRNEWPLPVGRNAIMEWVLCQAAWYSRKWQGDSWNFNILPEFNDAPDARLGLAVQRRAWDGDVWLLGTVERVPMDDKSMLWYAQKLQKGQSEEEQFKLWYDYQYLPSLTFGKAVIRHEPNALGIAAGRGKDLGILKEYAIEQSRGDDTTMADKAASLLRWYQKILLGEKIGRPKGSGTLSSRAEFEVKVRPIVAKLRSRGQYPSQEKVSEQFHCDPRQLRRWCQEFGVDWAEFVKE